MEEKSVFPRGAVYRLERRLLPAGDRLRKAIGEASVRPLRVEVLYIAEVAVRFFVGLDFQKKKGYHKNAKHELARGGRL